MNRFFLGTSVFDGGDNFRRDFFRIWCENSESVGKRASRTVIILEGGSSPPFEPSWAEVIRLTGNLGHCHDLIEGRKLYDYSGWSASMCALAMLAYLDESDFIYKESDALAFGPWVEQLYADMGDGDMAFGQKMKGPPWQVCSQSLFIVRHRFIPQMVAAYIECGSERSKANIGESKFVRIENKFGPHKVRRHSIPCDRERPIPWDRPIFHCQQWTPAELAEAGRRNLIAL